ncbi:hypothetical protein [Candidatus Solirubrobacter pratensis]|uniref:hypothetical protein n=1 Tax=Candidatus Solirubrobacter pratensis TaxID=1298857 RepID=UPI0012DD0245|nr:hypothetical protein [Candidatus Solirubrobacter pratensis]
MFPDRDRDAVERALNAALEAVRIGRHVHERAHVAARELGRVRRQRVCVDRGDRGAVRRYRIRATG